MVPGTAQVLVAIRGFLKCHAAVIFAGLYGTGLILIIVFVVRSLPTGTRPGISAFL